MLRTALAFLAVVLFSAPTLAGDLPPGLKVKDLKVGVGAEAVVNATVRVHYTGWLMDGTEFDSSLNGDPFSFSIGAGNVIPGWELGVEGMRVGGRRELIIPPELGYGMRGAGGVIPPNATLKFEVRLLAVKPPKYKNIDNAELKQMIARGVPVVDIRTPGEWKETGVVAGSHKIMAFDERGAFNPAFESAFEEVAGPGEEVILICRTGNRTAAVANFLQKIRGYKKVANVQHGITKWIAEGNPVTR